MAPKPRHIAVAYLLAALFFIGPAFGNDPLILVSVPWRTPDTLAGIYAPMIRLLEEQLDTRVDFFVAKDYQELGKRLDTGAADLGIFGGSAYVDAKDKYPDIRYLATCMQPTAYYNSLIIARKSCTVTSLAHLKGKSFAFTDKDSTSGYLYPRLMLSALAIDPGKDFSIVYFLKKHDKVYDAVAKGTIAAGGVSKTAFAKAVERNGDVFRVLCESDPIPRNAVVGAGHLPQARLDRIRTVLAQAAQTDVFKTSDSILKGFALKTDGFYDIVRKARTLKESR